MGRPTHPGSGGWLPWEEAAMELIAGPGGQRSAGRDPRRRPGHAPAILNKDLACPGLLLIATRSTRRRFADAGCHTSGFPTPSNLPSACTRTII